jgi:hypothetical protein
MRVCYQRVRISLYYYHEELKSYKVISMKNKF